MTEELSMDSSAFRCEAKTIPWQDGVDFFTKRWISTSLTPPRVLIIFLHGFAEHVERYDKFWPRFVARNIEVFGYDQRGFGRSGPRYGDTTLEQQVLDLEYAVHQERQRLNDDGHKMVPIFLYGHSMGGGVILSLLTRPKMDKELPLPIDGVIAAAPWILRTNVSF